jgi:hypothetical protein
VSFLPVLSYVFATSILSGFEQSNWRYVYFVTVSGATGATNCRSDTEESRMTSFS